MLKDNDAQFEVFMDDLDLGDFVQFEIPAEMVAGQSEEQILDMVMFMAMPTSPTRH
jgi:hypothetical protein